MIMDNLAFDIQLPLTKDKEKIRLEVTEDYEDDKFHVVVFIDGEHWDTVGLNTGNELLEYIRNEFK
tara:strand:+ start:583 stop:780 length:198 start_codon:yes stop_codon:yes gene_type:complete